MRSQSGIETAREILKAAPQVRIVFFTVHSERLLKREAMRAGASAYVSKQAPDDLIRAIYAALRQTATNTGVPRNGNDVGVNRTSRMGFAPGLLTPRQRDVLQLVVQGRALKEIAASLNISPKTVEFHKYRLMVQLRARSTAELIATAIRYDLVAL